MDLSFLFPLRYVIFCFVYFESFLTHRFRVVFVFSVNRPFYFYKTFLFTCWHFLPSIASVSVAAPAFSRLALPPALTGTLASVFSPPGPLDFKCFPYQEPTAVSFLFLSDNFFPLIGVLSLLTLNVLTDVIASAVLLFVIFVSHLFFVPSSVLAFYGLIKYFL